MLLRIVRSICLVIGLLSAVYSSAQTPNWTIDARAFQYSLNMTGAYFEDCESAGEVGDSVAAFSGSEIRGVAEVTEVGGVQTVAFLTVFSDSPSGDEISFKWYRKTQNEVVDLDVTLDFREGDILGSIAKPYAMFKGEAYILPEVTSKEDSIYIEVQDPSYASYQWYYEEDVLEDATEPYVITQENGTYSIEIMTESGCTIESEKFEFLLTGLGDLNADKFSLEVYPNPVSELVRIDVSLFEGEETSLVITDLTGVEVPVDILLTSDEWIELNTEFLKSGSYVISITSDTKEASQAIIKL